MNARIRAVAHRLAVIAAVCGALHAAAFAAAPSCPPVASMPDAAQIQAGVKAARDHGFLWRLRKGGHESWLYGTVHVARFEWMFPGPTIVKALRASDTIALELDVLDPDIRQRMAQGASASGTAALPEALTQRLQRQADAECLPPQALAGMRPEMQVATLESLIGRRDGLDPSYGIDIVLDGWARGEHKPVVSLETPELQLETLALPTPAETIEFVDSSLTEIESGQAAPALKQIAQVWADGDLDRLTHYESWCGCVNTATDRVAMKRLLDDRNPALADAIAALHASGQRVFAAVGSLHMIGPLGLPNLLARRGFEVRVVPFRADECRMADGRPPYRQERPGDTRMTTDPSSFSKLVPGFDFLQGLVKNAGAALPGIGQWVAPTIDPAELEKRIEELRTVQFWLEQNARMLGATIQALEVQRMTLSTLKTMNVQMEGLRDSLKIRVPEPAAPDQPAAPLAAVPAASSEEATSESPKAKTAAAASKLAAPAGVVDPMQWWGALTKQFSELATTAMKDSASAAATRTSPAATTNTVASATAKAAAKKKAPASKKKAMTKLTTGTATSKKAALRP